MISFFEIGATVLGLVQGVLVMLNKRANWIFYSLQMIFLFMFSLLSNLYGDLAGNAVYIAVGVAGFIMWGRDGKLPVKSCSMKERVLYSVLIVISTLVLFCFLRSTDDPLPLIDSFTTVSGIFATYYMLTKKLDAWILWFINDIFYIAEYYLLPDSAWYLMALNVIWTLMAVMSFFEWRRIMKKEENIKME